MKKKISLILFFALMFVSVLFMGNTVFAENAVNEKAGLLIKLGIIDENENDYEKEITRGEFAGYVVKFMGLEASGDRNKRYYIDVPASNHNAADINMLYELGIMSGFGNNIFAPNDYITPNDASKVILRIVGYRDVEGLQVDYGYYAQSYNLIKGNQEVLTYEQFINMAFEALTVPYMVREGNGSYNIDKSKNILSERFDVYVVEGVVSSVENVSLNDDVAGDNLSIIGDTIVENGDVDLYKAFGTEVTAYVRDTDDSYTVIYYTVKKGEEVIIINAYDMEQVDSLNIKYRKNNRTVTEKLPANIKVYKNGVQVKSDIIGALNIKNGEIKLLNDNKIAIVTEADYVIVSSYNADLEKIYTNYGEAIDVKAFKNEIFLFDANGKNISLDALQPGMFLEVFRSKSEIKMYVNNSAITGRITALDDEILEIEDKEYYYEPSCKEYVEKINNSSSIGKFYINRYGYVVYADYVKTSDTWNFGFVARSFIDEDNDGAAVLRIYTTDGVFVNLKTVTRVRVDDNISEPQSVAELFNDSPQLIRYKVNSNGEIISIDTSSTNTNDEFSLTDMSDGFHEKTYFANVGKFGTDIISKNAVIMRIPQIDLSDEEMYMINPKLQELQNYNVAAYTCNPDALAAEVVLVSQLQTGDTLDWAAPLCMLESIETVFDEKTEEVRRKVVCYGLAYHDTMGAGTYGRMEFYIAENYDPNINKQDKDGVFKSCPIDTLQTGDLFLMTRNHKNEIDCVYKAFDHSEDIKLPSRYRTEDGSGQARIASGYANKKVGNYVGIGYTSPSELDEIAYITTSTQYPVIVYDKNANKSNSVYIGSIEDVLTYENVGNEASVLVVHTDNGNPRQCFIYKYGIK